MAHLYGAGRQYVNYFQPSFKLVEKTRHGSRVSQRCSQSPKLTYRPRSNLCCAS